MSIFRLPVRDENFSWLLASAVSLSTSTASQWSREGATDGVAAASSHDTAPYGLDDLGHLINKRNGARDVVQHPHVAHLLPGHGQVLEELVDRVRDVLERAQVYSFVGLEFFGGHVAVVLDDLADVLGLCGTYTVSVHSRGASTLMRS